jgi:hypothetical protein
MLVPSRPCRGPFPARGVELGQPNEHLRRTRPSLQDLERARPEACKISFHTDEKARRMTDPHCGSRRASPTSALIQKSNRCEECNRLWRDFAVALGEQICASVQVKRAALACDTARVAELRPISQAAAASRMHAGLAIHKHEAIAHRTQPMPPAYARISSIPVKISTAQRQSPCIVPLERWQPQEELATSAHVSGGSSLRLPEPTSSS